MVKSEQLCSTGTLWKWFPHLAQLPDRRNSCFTGFQQKTSGTEAGGRAQQIRTPKTLFREFGAVAGH
jgi:hypothetical protein